MPEAIAGKPRAEIHFKNAKVERKFVNQISRMWLKYLEEFPSVLNKKGKSYKIDQKCVYEVELDEKGFVDLDSMRLVKHKNKDNFDFNLAAVDFLKRYFVQIDHKDKKKPIKLEFIYYAF